MLKYADKVLPTLALFFRKKNDIDIYIEDANDEEFYKTLLDRLLNDKIKIGRLISLGCKLNVIAACENDQIDRKRNRVYIVDSDLDLIFNNNRTDLKHLFIHDRYCIENYLIEETGIIEILHDCLILERKRIMTSLGLENWLKSISHPLIELFLHYSITHECQLGTKTVSTSIGTFCKQDRNITVLDIAKVNVKIEELRTEIISSKGDDYYASTIYNRRISWPSNITTLLKIVSGKDYLLPLLMFRFKKLRGQETFSLKKEVLRMRLAKTIDLKNLQPLKLAISA